jgi:hypothetical protein
MKRQLNIRISEPASRKLAALTAKYGSQTIVAELAIDRLYQKEIKMDAKIVVTESGIKVLDANGHAVDFDAAVNVMDEDIREALHARLAPCEPQVFMAAYEAAHLAKYGEDFNVG